MKPYTNHANNANDGDITIFGKFFLTQYIFKLFYNCAIFLNGAEIIRLLLYKDALTAAATFLAASCEDMSVLK